MEGRGGSYTAVGHTLAEMCEVVDRKGYAVTTPLKACMIFCRPVEDNNAVADTQADIDAAAGRWAVVFAGPEKVSIVVGEARHWKVDGAVRKAFQIYSHRPLSAYSLP